MRSKTSFFNRTVFRSDCKRWWPLTAGYALLWFLILPLTQITELDYNRGMHPSGMLRNVLGVAGTAGYWVAFFAAILFAMAAFSYLTNPRAANGLHALPARRETLYLTHFLSGLCSQLAVQVLAVLLTAAVLASHGAADARVIGLMLLALVLPTLFFYGFAVFCMMFTGQILAAPVFYAALNFLVVGVEFLLRTFAGNFLYGWAGDTTPRLTAFSPLVKLIEVGVRADSASVRNALPDGSYEVLYIENGPMTLTGLDWLLVYALVGLVFAALGLLVYRSRHSEATGNTVAIAWAKPIFKYGVAFCAALALGQFLYYLIFGQYRMNGDYSLPGTLACMAAAGLIGYFLAEMLLKKSFRVFRSGLVGAAAITAALVLLGVAMSFDLTGYEGYVPDASLVVSADVRWSGYYGGAFSAEVRDAKTVRLLTNAHRAVVNDKLRQLAADRDYDNIFSQPNAIDKVGAGSLRIRYRLKNGAVVSRSYDTVYIWADELDTPMSTAAAMTALYNAPSVTIQRALDSGGWREPMGDPRELTDLRFTGGHFYRSLWSEDESYLGEEQRELTAAEATQIYEAILADVEAGRISESLFGDDQGANYQFELYATCRGNGARAEGSTLPADMALEPDREPRMLHPRVTRQMTETVATLRAMGLDIDFD